jgi:ElaB/YqjD/DUF883 family membrane-anchored ribosome-binding protein
MKPIAKKSASWHGDESVTYEHPAQGLISVTKSNTSGHMELFGSQLKHSSCIRIEIHNAEVTRNLNRDWTHARDLVTEFYFSESQWGQFVSSIGNGGGTPITFSRKPVGDYTLPQVPDYEVEETVATFSKEMKKSVKKFTEYALGLSKEMEQLLAESGTPSKTKMKELSKTLVDVLKHLPANLEFVETSFNEAMEDSVESAKSEVEGFVRNTLIKSGIEHLQNEAKVRLIDDKSGEQ